MYQLVQRIRAADAEEGGSLRRWAESVVQHRLGSSISEAVRLTGQLVLEITDPTKRPEMPTAPDTPAQLSERPPAKGRE